MQNKDSLECWLISAIASVSMYPDILKEKIFISKFEFNDLGIYAVRLFDDGIPKCFILDDKLPLDIDRESIYLNFIRKAMMKMYLTNNLN